MRRFAVFSFTLALAFSATAATPVARPAAPDTKIPSPVEQPLAVIDALRANDAEALAEAGSRMSSDELAQKWEKERAKALRDERVDIHDEQGLRVWNQLQTPEGTAALADELHPKIIEKAGTAVLHFNLGFAAMLTAIASEAELDAEESRQLMQLALAVQRWANGIDWSDRTRLARALEAVAALIRRSGLGTPHELASLPYERALALGDEAIATAKDVLRAYDLDIDATLASIELEEVERNGNRATLRTSARVLDVPLTLTRDLEFRDGHWREARAAATPPEPGPDGQAR